MKGLGLNPGNKWISTNLALGLTQLDRLEEAKHIFTQFKNESHRDKLYRDIFIADKQELEEKGIPVKNKDDIFELLGR